MRILVVDDQRLMREGLATILNLEPDMEVVGTAADGRDAYAKVIEWRPDAVLMDIRMPGMDGVEASALILKHFPETKILILTTFDDEELILQALDQGVHGYLLKDMPSEAIVSAIYAICNGGTVLQPEITSMLLKGLNKEPAGSPRQIPSFLKNDNEELARLTEQEKKVLALLADGLNNKEIASVLYITEGTAKNHLSSVMAKLGLRDRTQAAIFAVRRLP
ncbi:response regulator transcription factor [Bacillus sp. FJAT-26390]|uniref:response regulator n=1 Tax=Bacillus sp. FJAT-26390 TaxID=1743142 RepID=UPI000807C9EF|nr:response regulator transcription factor [Bacillus sp. FJAT-26390]OBZ15802.1 DNA-binding response regulator [Bacillus sp. FJAT-26390]